VDDAAGAREPAGTCIERERTEGDGHGSLLEKPDRTPGDLLRPRPGLAAILVQEREGIMKKEIVRAGTVAMALLAAAGCSRSSSLTQPTPSPTSANATAYTVSGVVFALAPASRAPLADAVISIDGQDTAVTDANGAFEAHGSTKNANLTVMARKAGYNSVQFTVAAGNAVRLDFNLEVNVVGHFTLSGVIADATPAGPIPAEGVTIEVFSCPDTRCLTYVSDTITTDKTGTYTFSGLYQAVAIWLSRNGMLLEDTPPEPAPCDGCFRLVMLSADSRIDILLQPPR
jgi:hypothetical protein